MRCTDAGSSTPEKPSAASQSKAEDADKPAAHAKSTKGLSFGSGAAPSASSSKRKQESSTEDGSEVVKRSRDASSKKTEAGEDGKPAKKKKKKAHKANTNMLSFDA